MSKTTRYCVRELGHDGDCLFGSFVYLGEDNCSAESPELEVPPVTFETVAFFRKAIQYGGELSAYRQELEHLLDRVNSTESALYASELINQHYREALTWILDSPYGCPYCDSGQLRNTQKEHDDKCGFAKAQDLIGGQS